MILIVIEYSNIIFSEVNRKMKICVLHRPYRNTEWQTKFSGQKFADDAIEEARHHAEAIRANGHSVEIITWSNDMTRNIKALRAGNYDLVVNASSLEEVALLEILHIPFMGSGIDLVATDKTTRKRLWRDGQILTPAFAHITNMDQLAAVELPPFPLFVKPVRGRGSAGITDESIVHNQKELERACQRILYTMHQGVLIEEYIQGIEVTIGLIGNGADLIVLPPLEIEYSGQARTNTFAHKQDNEIFHCPARLPEEDIRLLCEAAKRAYNSLGARDFGRVDFIYDPKTRRPYALELNTFAGLQILSGDEEHLHQSYIGKMCEQMGWTSQQLFERLLATCQRRLKEEMVDESANN